MCGLGAFSRGTESLERSDKDVVERLKAGSWSGRLPAMTLGTSPIGNALTRIVPRGADNAFSFMAVWREPAGSDGMMQGAVWFTAATVWRSSFRQVPKIFMLSAKSNLF
jgi:hypothetical protein